jgi:hypothetical protein
MDNMTYKNRFITSDTHFGHRSIIEYEDRPYFSVENMNNQLIINWNKRVKDSDLVYLLGDVFIGMNKSSARDILDKLNGVLKEIRATEAGTKLCSTLEDGENYLMDWENFLFYERMGYDMTVKRCFKFEQSAFLKPYIDMNSGLRQKSTTAISKQLYKDLNNIIYGKSLQNPMKYGNVELITSENVLQKRIRNPLLKRCEIIVEDKLVLTDLYQETMKFDTCIQYGFHVLEKSKLLMYSTLYEKIVPLRALRI